MPKVRTRYAPSPTGFPHVGNIRTALFNWLFARSQGGDFILRIEDTDIQRRVEGAVEDILDSLSWLNLLWDEGPYFQSERLAYYQEAARKLVEGEYAYPCYCSPQRLKELREEQMKHKEPPGYDRRCRYYSPEEREKFKGTTPVIRFKVPLSGEIQFRDLIYGEVSLKCDTIDDFIILKSDGYPTYHLASVVDDHLMGITHVLRAEEWLSSTPRHLLLYEALGYSSPSFAHLPMILGPDKGKLSKRTGAPGVTELRRKGYLPEAVVNFLALLGWAFDDKTEIFSTDELIARFSLEGVSLNPAVFNLQKLTWMNGLYLRRESPEEFARLLLPFLDRDLPSSVRRSLDPDYVAQIAPLIQERIRTLGEAAEATSFFFMLEVNFDPSLLKRSLPLLKMQTTLKVALEKLELLSSFDTSSLESLLRPLAESLNLKTGDLFQLLRLALTGRTASPPLFQTMEVLGKERCLHRIERAIMSIEQS
jgi:glutamyl-tRNA synthetase